MSNGIEDQAKGDSLQIISRALAYLALHVKRGDGATIHEQATFLAGLGLSSGEVAGILGTTMASLRTLRYQAKGKKGGKKVSPGAKRAKGGKRGKARR